MIGTIDLLDYRRSVAELYRQLRQPQAPPEVASERFRRQKDELFRSHPASPLGPRQRHTFNGLEYYPYDPNCRVIANVGAEAEGEIREVELREDGVLRLQRIARAEFELFGEKHALPLFWILGYGGGLFLPFSDETCGAGSYGGGRYLLDTIKGADLGSEDGRLVLDFNHAYNPSCAYNPRWHCPLPAPESRMEVSVIAGEKAFRGSD